MFNFHPRIVAGVQALGYLTPTPIQQQAIPPALQGRDVMGLAQTGTGKTAAFALPILQRLLQRPHRHVRALIIAPTRELAEQIHVTIGTLGQQTAVRSMTLYGGVSILPQLQQVRRGVDIAVACPGRLLDHLRQGTVDLSSLEVLVLDEADRLFDMGFIPDIRQIMSYVPAQRQTLLFAATMPNDVRCLAHDILSDPVTVQVGPMGPAPTVSHALYPVEPQHKTTGLLALLRHTELASVLVFTRTQHRAAAWRSNWPTLAMALRRCRATYRSVSVRLPSMVSGPGPFRSWCPRTSRPAASMWRTFHTLLTMTCQTRLKPIPIVSGALAALHALAWHLPSLPETMRLWLALSSVALGLRGSGVCYQGTMRTGPDPATT
jgi:superfamily II DNA/RNA helicase